MGWITWIVIGLIAGFIARALVPGRNKLGFAGTLVLGLIGSVVGGFLADLLTKGNQDFSPAGLIGSIVGAVIALLVYRGMAGRTA
jgi:uncharacterized membrane protein YeaQ/YmgE (transglycosylase-associated protein family)